MMRSDAKMKIIALIALAAFAAVAILGLFLYTHMDMAGMSGCNSLHGELTLCPMSVFEHISAWQAALRGITFKLLLSVLALAAAFMYLLPPVLSRPKLALQFSGEASSPKRKKLSWLSLFENSPNR